MKSKLRSLKWDIIAITTFGETCWRLRGPESNPYRGSRTSTQGSKWNLGGTGYHIKIFDAYRPQRAVNDFVKWAEDVNDIKMKKQYYPNIDKTRLFELGYIASRSGHTRGSVVDLTIVDTQTGMEVDMGSGFDFWWNIPSWYRTYHQTTRSE